VWIKGHKEKVCKKKKAGIPQATKPQPPNENKKPAHKPGNKPKRGKARQYHGM
jgi:hypothetical protein